MKGKIFLDLSDLGIDKPLPPVETQRDVTPKEEIDTSHFGIPVALALMIQPVHCQSCGQDHYEHQGLTLELQFPSHHAYRAVDQWERAAYTMLPRRLEYRPMMTLDFCRDCFAIEEAVLKLLNTEPVGERPQRELVKSTGTRITLPLRRLKPVEVDVDVEGL